MDITNVEDDNIGSTEETKVSEKNPSKQVKGKVIYIVNGVHGIVQVFFNNEEGIVPGVYPVGDTEKGIRKEDNINVEEASYVLKDN